MRTIPAVPHGVTPVLTAAGGAVRRSWRRRITRRAIDASTALAGRRLLVLAAHPDEETVGCGALIARAAAAGDPATVVVATDGSRAAGPDPLRPTQIVALRRAELHAACARLGTTRVVELGYPDGSLPDHRVPLTADIIATIERHRPGAVLVPCAQDQHPDRQALYASAVAAVRGMARPPLLLAYPVWTWHAAPVFSGVGNPSTLPGLWAWAARQAVSGRWWRVPTGGYLDRKRAAVATYTSTYPGTYPGRIGHDPGGTVFLGPDEMFLPVHL